MSGYYGYSMSNNAVEAYANGEKPLSKWIKGDILEYISLNFDDSIDMDLLKKVPAKALKNLCLSKSSWHHTSNHFNKTDFYVVDSDKVSNITVESIDLEIKKCTQTTLPIEEKWKCAFLEWSGTRKHPKSTEYIEEGIIKGEWFIRADGSKKKTTANGFRRIEKL